MPEFKGNIPGEKNRFFRQDIAGVVFYNDGTEDLAYICDQQGFPMAPDDMKRVVNLIGLYIEKYGPHHAEARKSVIETYYIALVGEAQRRFEQLREEAKKLRAQLATWERKHNRGAVYIIKSSKSNICKIGYSKNKSGVSSRLTTFQSNSPVPLSIHRVFRTDDPVLLEKEFHARFAKKRQHGEWFDLSDEDYAYLDSLNEDGSEPEQDTELKRAS